MWLSVFPPKSNSHDFPNWLSAITEIKANGLKWTPWPLLHRVAVPRILISIAVSDRPRDASTLGHQLRPWPCMEQRELVSPSTISLESKVGAFGTTRAERTKPMGITLLPYRVEKEEENEALHPHLLHRPCAM